MWKALCLNAKHIVSSHAERYVYEPFRLSTGHKPEWKFTFLQHGVIKDDLSRWLNPKLISSFVATTKPEFDSLVGNGSPYLVTTKEVRLTGLPRHDRLARLAHAADESPAKRSIVVMPTWRQYLVGGPVQGASAREAVSGFLGSDFHREWTAFLRSDQLREMAGQHDLDVVFMPHPNLKPYLSMLELPDHIRIASYQSDDVQEVLSNAAVVVTDYSSLAFDAAFIRRPVVYFQFDKATVFGGAHTTRPGYFAYERDGFGPVAYTLEGALEGLSESLDPDSGRTAVYRERMDRTFTLPQRGACARVVRMIERSERPLTFRQARRRTVIAPEAPPINFDFRTDLAEEAAASRSTEGPLVEEPVEELVVEVAPAAR